MTSQSYMNRYLAYILFFALVFIFYYSTLSNGLSLDDHFIYENIPREGSKFWDIFSVFNKRFDVFDYRPVSMLSFATEQWLLDSLNPKVSHFINLILYGLLCCIIYSTLQLFPIKNISLIAFLTTLLFLTHPVHSGVVNNLKSRDGILSMLFCFLAIRQYIFYISDSKKYHLLLLLLFFVLGIFSKLDAFNLIVILPLIHFFIYNKSIKEASFIIIALVILHVLFRIILVDYFVPVNNPESHAKILFTENPLSTSGGFAERIGLSITSFFYYLKFIVIPKGYYYYFGYNQIPARAFYHPIVLLQFVLISLPILISIFFLKRTKLILFGVLFFYASLLYCSNLFILVQGIVADRYVFIASLGLFFAFAVFIINVLPYDKIKASLEKRNPAFVNFISNPNRVGLLITILLIILYYPFVQKRNIAWENIYTLIETDIPYLKKSFEANRIAASAYAKAAFQSISNDERTNYFLKSLQYAKQANKIYPNHIYTNETEGIAYYGLGKIQEAERKFISTIQKFDSSTVSWDLLGDINFKRKNYDSSALCYFNVIRVEPLNDPAYYKYPFSLQLAGKEDSAISYLTQLSRKYPNWYVPYESASYIYYNNGDTIKGLNYMVRSFEKGLKNETTFRITVDMAQRHKQQDLLVRLSRIGR